LVTVCGAANSSIHRTGARVVHSSSTTHSLVVVPRGDDLRGRGHNRQSPIPPPEASSGALDAHQEQVEFGAAGGVAVRVCAAVAELRIQVLAALVNNSGFVELGGCSADLAARLAEIVNAAADALQAVGR
jgi:hypothetical protein